MFSRRASRSTTVSCDLEDSTNSILAEVMGIGLHHFPIIELDREVVEFLNGFADHIDIQTEIARRETELASRLKDEYISEGPFP